MWYCYNAPRDPTLGTRANRVGYNRPLGRAERKVVSVSIATKDVGDCAAACFVGFDEDHVLLWDTTKKKTKTS